MEKWVISANMHIYEFICILAYMYMNSILFYKILRFDLRFTIFTPHPDFDYLDNYIWKSKQDT